MSMLLCSPGIAASGADHGALEKGCIAGCLRSLMLHACALSPSSCWAVGACACTFACKRWLKLHVHANPQVTQVLHGRLLCYSTFLLSS